MQQNSCLIMLSLLSNNTRKNNIKKFYSNLGKIKKNNNEMTDLQFGAFRGSRCQPVK
jgi:hypothetical protein